jgi:hypothetical protein
VTDLRPQRLEGRGIGVERRTPALERTLSWLSEPEGDGPERSGVGTWSGLELAALLVAQEAMLRPDRLFTIAEAEQQLAQLSKYYPELVDDALARLSLPNLTRILRAILVGRGSLANLRAILQRLVLFADHAVDAPADWRVLGDLLPTLPVEDEWQRMVAYARLDLGEDILADDVPPGRPVVVLPVDMPDEQTAAGDDALLDRVWATVRDRRLRNASPVLVTDMAALPRLQALVRAELPDVVVVAWPELPASWSIVDISQEDGPVIALESVTRSRVQEMLSSIFGAVTVDEDDDFVVFDEGLPIYVGVHRQRDLILIQVFSYSNIDVPPSAELYQWVAMGASNLTFGRVQLVPSRDDETVRVLISHDLLGNYLDSEELALAVFGVSNNAKSSGTEVQERFGGRRPGEPVLAPDETSNGG